MPSAAPSTTRSIAPGGKGGGWEWRWRWGRDGDWVGDEWRHVYPAQTGDGLNQRRVFRARQTCWTDVASAILPAVLFPARSACNGQAGKEGSRPAELRRRTGSVAFFIAITTHHHHHHHPVPSLVRFATNQTNLSALLLRGHLNASPGAQDQPGTSAPGALVSTRATAACPIVNTVPAVLVPVRSRTAASNAHSCALLLLSKAMHLVWPHLQHPLSTTHALAPRCAE